MPRVGAQKWKKSVISDFTWSACHEFKRQTEKQIENLLGLCFKLVFGAIMLG